MALGLSQTGPPRILGDLPGVRLTKYAVSTWWTTYFSITSGTEMEPTNENLKDMESSASGDSDKGFLHRGSADWGNWAGPS